MLTATLALALTLAPTTVRAAAYSRPSAKHNLTGETNHDDDKHDKQRAPSCGGCDRRESVLSKQLRLSVYSDLLSDTKFLLLMPVLLAIVCYVLFRLVSRKVIWSLLCIVLYFIASPTAIMCNKILMKDHGFGYPILVSAFGQLATMLGSALVVRLGGVSIANGANIGYPSLLTVGASSALSLVLGQIPYFYLTVAFIQMLKAFSPAYIIFLLWLLGIESPSRKVVLCVLGLSVCTAIASAGEVSFSLIGVLFMTAASFTDSVRLVVAQKILQNQSMHPIEALYYISPMCLVLMLPFALVLEMPTVIRRGSFHILVEHPTMTFASAFSGLFVNVTSYLLVRRTSSTTLKLLTMVRNGGLVLASAIFFAEVITPLEWVGYGGLLVFFGMYTYIKQAEKAAPLKPQEKGAQREEVEPLTDASDLDEVP